MIGPTSEMNIIYSNEDVAILHYNDGSIKVYSEDNEESSVFSGLSTGASSLLIQTIVDVAGSYQASEIINKFKQKCNEC